MNIQALKDAGYAEAIFEDAKEAAFSEARKSFTPIINEVQERGSRYCVTRHGKPTAAIVPINDLLRLMQLDRSERMNIDIDFTESDEALDFQDKGQRVLDQHEAQHVAELVAVVSQIPEVREYLDDEKSQCDEPKEAASSVNSEQNDCDELPATGH
ncbi:MAG: type II toxin-antitoxin system Phd/YefM family antitoxin [Pseudomonadota bacterium]